MDVTYVTVEAAAIGRKNNFDLLRLLLASLVILTHSFALLKKDVITYFLTGTMFYLYKDKVYFSSRLLLFCWQFWL